MKLKTRFFINYDLKAGKNQEKYIQENLAKFVRCIACNSIITEEIAV